ncbi:hypothetical protein H5410_020760 [Solanum commersonii]|uniref:Uncharacterized protein n=1 Tax=Solanum commersonii TaxID=4109 RepID=A0A9J5ZC21_SOLCO|nr:hypothetical protein H5410_020760 [Solanum commersonii]
MRFIVINMVEVTIYFHHGGEWLTSPEPHYDRGCVTYWKRLGFVGVQELIVLAPTGKYFEIIGDEGVRTLTSFISTEYKSIHLFATEDCELSVDVIDIVMHDGSFLLSLIANEGTDCSESEDDSNNGMVFSCSDYDTDELENFISRLPQVSSPFFPVKLITIGWWQPSLSPSPRLPLLPLPLSLLLLLSGEPLTGGGRPARPRPGCRRGGGEGGEPGNIGGLPPR